jgi:general secretion pathway protein I
VIRSRVRGFTLVEVLVALIVVAMGLAALMVAVSGTARTSGQLRDKTLAQWIALNHISEVRLNVNKSGSGSGSTLTSGSLSGSASSPSSSASSSSSSMSGSDMAELDFAGRKWHYDTRYFDTSIQTMKRIVVRVYAGDAKTKGNPLAESTSFFGTALAAPGGSNIDWTQGSTVTTSATGAPAGATSTNTVTGGVGSATTGTTTPTSVPTSPQPAPQPAPQQAPQ